MNERMNGENRQNSLTEEFQIIFVDSSPHQGDAVYSPPLERGLCLGLPSKESRVKGGGGLGVTLRWRNLTDVTSARRSRSPVMSHLESVSP